MTLRKVGAMWLREKNGKKYMSGSVNESLPSGTKLLMYRNDYKKDEKHPDYTLHVVDDEADQSDRRQDHSQLPAQDETPF